MEGFSDKFFHQKRVHAHRPGWKRLLKGRFFLEPFTSNGFSGYVSLILMDEVSSPLVKTIQRVDITVVGKGFSWLQYYMTGADYSAVATFNPENRLVQWYVDVISQMGVDKYGYPWYDDLYLDVVATPDGLVEIIDGEELDMALMNKAIDQPMHQQAWITANRLAEELRNGNFWLSDQAENDRFRISQGTPIRDGNW